MEDEEVEEEEKKPTKRGPDESEHAYLKRRFEEAYDEASLDEIDRELREEGYSPGNIRVLKSKRRKELKHTNPTAISVAKPSSQLSAEAIVDSLPWPTDVDGKVHPAFVAGMRYEAFNIIRGIRLAQELNRMGLEQAKPVIEMAKEMRQAEGQAAQIIASQQSQMIMESNQQILNAISQIAMNQNKVIPDTAGNPMLRTIAETMQPYLAQILGQLLGGVFKIPANPQAQPSQSAWSPPNIVEKSADQFKEDVDVQS